MKRNPVYILLILIWLPLWVEAQSIVNTVHNLSVTGPGNIKANTESEICVFCHTPHTSAAKSPLWNRRDPGLTYTLYNNTVSSTLQANPGQPDGSSILCLSCHDGTIALGNVLSRSREISFARGMNLLTTDKNSLGKDLSNDHPVSFQYNSSLAAMDPELKDPAAILKPVKLEDGKVQCTSCHDPHKNLFGDFLLVTTENSLLCLTCHQPANWAVSSHRTSNATWDGRGRNPWEHSPSNYNTVAKNACENCHKPHSAGGKARLMNYQIEETNCLNCHSGTVASSGKNIQAQLAKTYKHDVNLYAGIHDPSEAALLGSKHVECSDCHNPHAANGNPATPPLVSGALTGVKGISASGMPVENAQYEYEICFRCHSSRPATSPTTPRQIAQSDARLEFAANSISFHPVEIKGKNNQVPGLIAPLNENSLIYCSSCHASNGPDAPAGPHGSIYPHILKYQYSTSENVAESSSAYALCYSCHSRTEYSQDAGDNVNRLVHYKHVVEVKTSCNTCHDPHGISSTQGLASRNSHLINFNTSVVSSMNGNLYFQDDGYRSGKCYLTCHNHTHSPAAY